MFKETVSNKKKFLSSLVKAPLAQLENVCAEHWHAPDELNQALSESLCRLPHCQLLYLIRIDGIQLTGNFTRNGIDDAWIGQDLANRPYFTGNLPFRGMILSAAYLSQRSMQPCITAVQAINHQGELLGFIAADFHLKDLPIINTSTLQRMHLQNSQHHPTRGSGKQLKRSSETDVNIDYLIYALSTLMQEHGVFHCKLHFDSERCNLWSYQEPHHYHLHNISELMSSELFNQYPPTEFNQRSIVSAEQIPVIFAQLKALRQADDNTYLHSGSLNIVNGIVGLTFSHDEPQYLSVEEFLNHDLGYWLNKDQYIEQQIIEKSSQN
ncbi:MAG: PDC sensor domain-containing protein [Thioalkalispiraceae bacterium]